jgi:zinc protease
MTAMILAAAVGAAPSTGAGPSGFPFPIRIEKLPNGLRVALVKYDSPGLVAYYTLVRTGSRNEVEPGHTGFAHLFEHIMFKGTKKFGAFDSAIGPLGWHNNAWTSDDETVYTDFGPTATLPRVIEIEADRFRNLSYSPDEFKTETRAVLGEYNKNASQPGQQLEETLAVTAFTQHTYRHTTMGFKADIDAMPSKYDYSLKFFKRYYTPDNCVIVIAGDFDADAVLAVIKKNYGDWKGKVEEPRVPVEPLQKEERRAKIDWPTEVLPQLLFAYRAPPASDWKASAIQDALFAYLLGATSPLHKSLVLDRQIAEPFEEWTRPHRDPYVWAFLATGKTEAALPEIEKALDAAIAEVVAGKVDADRLEKIKSNRRYGLLMGLDDADSVASTLAAWTSPTGEVDSVDRFMAALGALTPADLTAFAKERLVPAQRSIVTLLPHKAEAAPAAKKEGAK